MAGNVTTGRILTWDEWVQAADYLEARARSAEQNGLPKTALAYRDRDPAGTDGSQPAADSRAKNSEKICWCVGRIAVRSEISGVGHQ